MKTLSKLLILLLCATFGVAECGILQRFSALSQGWVRKGIMATVASYWFMKPATLWAQGAENKTYSDGQIEAAKKLFPPEVFTKGKLCKWSSEGECTNRLQYAFDGLNHDDFEKPKEMLPEDLDLIRTAVYSTYIPRRIDQIGSNSPFTEPLPKNSDWREAHERACSKEALEDALWHRAVSLQLSSFFHTTESNGESFVTDDDGNVYKKGNGYHLYLTPSQAVPRRIIEKSTDCTKYDTANDSYCGRMKNLNALIDGLSIEGIAEKSGVSRLKIDELKTEVKLYQARHMRIECGDSDFKKFTPCIELCKNTQEYTKSDAEDAALTFVAAIKAHKSPVIFKK